MPLGDSITQGQRVEVGYRRGLWLRLQQAGYDVDFVGSMHEPFMGVGIHDYDQDHEGHWGWTADRVLTNLAAWAQVANPDIVLLHLGTNDMAADQSLAETVQELRDIIAILRRQNARVTVLMAQLIPGGHPKLYDAIVRLNARLADELETFQAPGSPVILVDQFTGFDYRVDTFDGLHPNATGAAKMVERWYAALTPVLKATQSPVQP